MSGNVHGKPYRLAAAAYHAALERKWETAARAVKRINDECGGGGLAYALRAWIDTLIDHATDGRPRADRPRRMNYINADTGELDDDQSQRLPARVRWAGKLVVARAAMDHTAWATLITEMPDDRAQVGEYVMTVLEAVAATVNGLPRGYALMGRSL